MARVRRRDREPWHRPRGCLTSGGEGAEQGDGLRGEPLAAAGETEPVRRRRPHVDQGVRDSECVGETLAHHLPMRRDPRLLADHDAVGVDELEAGVPHLPVRRGEQDERVGAPVALVVGRKERTDVAEPGRSEERVGEGMRHDVSVRMADESPRMVDAHAAENERDALAERVRIDAEADAEVAHAGVPATDDAGCEPMGDRNSTTAHNSLI